MITYPSKCEMECELDGKKVTIMGEMGYNEFLADIRTAKWKEKGVELYDIEKEKIKQYLKNQEDSTIKIIIIETEEESQKYVYKPTYEDGLRGDEIEILCKKIKKTKNGYRHIALIAWCEYIRNKTQMKYEKVCFYSKKKLMKRNEIGFINKEYITYHDDKTPDGYNIISEISSQNFNKKNKEFSANQKLHLILKFIRMKNNKV